MADTAAICERCGHQKDGLCYGRGRQVSYEVKQYATGAIYERREWVYPPCPTEREQNGMRCPQWEEAVREEEKAVEAPRRHDWEYMRPDLGSQNHLWRCRACGDWRVAPGALRAPETSDLCPYVPRPSEPIEPTVSAFDEKEEK